MERGKGDWKGGVVERKRTEGGGENDELEIGKEEREYQKIVIGRNE